MPSDSLPSPTVVLITGAGTGFGLLTAKALLERGHSVVATMPDPAGRHRAGAEELAALAASTGASVAVADLDVTSDRSVEAAVAGGLARFGRIDVAMNNAGISMGGFAEAFSAEEMARVFDVNVLGAQRVNRAVLPGMRAAGSGLLIHVSSTFGRFVVPYVAPYSASKWALEALAESYARELAGTGVGVAIVEPGAFDTGHAERIGSPADGERAADYGELAEVPGRMWPAFVERMAAAAPDPVAVAEAVVRLVEMPAGERALRVVVDRVTGGRVVERLNDAAAELGADYFEALGIAGVLDRSRGES